ncbi:SGNH/GDSL hydrolase family protein [Dyella sp.]|uniref:SGNH/GDSL hydrolase family protein n=1 Tax=Dyella sp. TaxID=1869338 RepID=UPI002ED5B7A3
MQYLRQMAGFVLFVLTGAAHASATISTPQQLYVPQSNPPSLSKAAAGADTYTYLRCHYRDDTSVGATSTRYEWALDGAGAWYHVQGYWAGRITPGANMFYTETSISALRDTCRQTLDRRGIHADVVMVAASDSALSPFNYSLWTQHPGDASKISDRVISFGDSLSDTHNIFSASLGLLPASGSWFLGRFSDGPVWTEHLAKALDLPLVNWAVGAAGTNQHFAFPGFPQQVDSWLQYSANARNYEPARSIFTIMFGGNDFINRDVSPSDALKHMEIGTRKLLDAGARKLLIANLPDITQAPVFAQRSDGPAVAAKVAEFNTGLAAMVNTLSEAYAADIVLFDAASLFDEVMSSPEPFGFSNTAQSCLHIERDAASNYTKNLPRRPGCDPAHYVFWDLLHPTSRTHGVLGETALRAMPEGWH